MIDINALVQSFVQDNPSMASFLFLMSVSRVVFKFLQGRIEAYVESTMSKTDDEKWQEIKRSRPYRTISMLLDFTASIKLPKAQ